MKIPALSADPAATARTAPPVSFDSTLTLLQTRALDPPARPGLVACLDRFEILEGIGAGGMGLVFLARDPRARRRVAIKLLRPELVRQPRAVAQFLTEARHMARLRHPHILPVLEVVNRPEAPYYVMPFLKAGALARQLQSGQPLPSTTVLALARQVGQALTYAHRRGLIHRDLKPDNVLLDDAGRARLADFGLARTLAHNFLIEVKERQYIGTAAYMSPAVAAGQAEDTRCDIYAFGVLLYEMLAGQPPYQGDNPEQILRQIRGGPPRPLARRNPAADPRLVSIAEGAMARELRDRYAQMADVLADLERVAAGLDPLGPRGRLCTAQPPHLRRLRPHGLAVLIGGAVVAASLVGVGLGRVTRAPHTPQAGSGPAIPATTLDAGKAHFTIRAEAAATSSSSAQSSAEESGFSWSSTEGSSSHEITVPPPVDDGRLPAP